MTMLHNDIFITHIQSIYQDFIYLSFKVIYIIGKNEITSREYNSNATSARLKHDLLSDNLVHPL